VRKTSLSRIEQDILLEGAKVRKVCRFLDATHMTEVLEAISLSMTLNMAELTHKVLE